jgi:hypothetical protein
MSIDFNIAEGKSVSIGGISVTWNTATPPSENDFPTVILSGTYTASVIAGRVSTLELQDAGLVSVAVTSQPTHGRVTVNPDNTTIACVLTESFATDNVIFGIDVTDGGGTRSETVTLTVTAGTQADGWGLGEFYMLKTGGNDEIIVEHGENHRVVYLSTRVGALTLANIAALEGLDVSAINGAFFLANPEYGASEGMSLAEDSGKMLWDTITQQSAGPVSNWLLLERGYEYNNLGTVIRSGTQGESELNPIYIGAYGTGAQPIINTRMSLIQSGCENLVIEGIAVTDGIRFVAGGNILINDISSNREEIILENIDRVTIRNSSIIDVYRDAPTDGISWRAGADRVSGIYMANSQNALIENNFFDHVGWEEGYDYNGSIDFGQPPSKYSHNAYLQSDNSGITFRNNLTMRSAANGVQVRSGGFVEGNIFLDNNIGALLGPGEIVEGAALGNYSIFTDNIVTSAGYRESADGQGALSWGVNADGFLPSTLNNVITHLADPNNASELAAKYDSGVSLSFKEGVPIYDNTIVYNWAGSDDYDGNFAANNQNTEGLNFTTLNQTTIQKHTEAVLGGGTKTIADYATHLRGLTTSERKTALTSVLNFFRTGFGISTSVRGSATTARFAPNPLGDGMRWDNRLNWSTSDIPGLFSADNVNLAGNWVYYGGTNTIANLDFGSGGKLVVGHGFLETTGTVSAGAGGGAFEISRSGQVWIDGYTDSDTLTVTATGGRFVNQGAVTGDIDVIVSGNAQVALCHGASSFELDGDLTITGGNAKVGYSGTTGTGTLTGSGSISLVAASAALPVINKFSLNGDMTLGGTFNATATGITLNVDATGMTAGDYTIFDCDALTGTFTSGTLTNCTVAKVGNTYVATVA